jgi:hypothetical protein
MQEAEEQGPYFRTCTRLVWLIALLFIQIHVEFAVRRLRQTNLYFIRASALGQYGISTRTGKQSCKEP